MRHLKLFTVVLCLSAIIIPFSSLSYPGEIVSSFDTPGMFPTGLTFNGNNLWVADRKTDLLYEVNPQNGETQFKIEAPGYWPSGLTWDGENLWCSDVKGGIPLSENYDGKIYKVDPENGTVLKTISAPTDAPRGLAWDGEYLWCTDNHSNKIFQFSPGDGTEIKSFKAPAGGSRSITYAKGNLWITDRKADEIYRVDPNTGTVTLVTPTPDEFTTGITYAGESLYAVDDQVNTIFKLKREDDENHRKSKKRTAKITYLYQIRNYGPGSVKEIDAHLAIPKDRDNQNILTDITYSPDYTDVITDKWNQKTAHYHFENISSGETKNLEMTTKAEIYDVRYFIFPEKVGKLSDIPDKITDKYLANEAKYQINHPVIQNALKKVTADTDNPYWKARKLYNYVIDNMHYEMVGGWNTAPTVLKRGSGSCSEYTFAYISLCRAAGIPARYVGSLVVRGDDTAIDDVFHRWVEIYLPNYGWIPVDPSGGDQKKPSAQADYFGHLSNRFLITTVSGGGSKTMEWTYNSNESYVTEPKTHLVIDYFAQWAPLD